MMIAIPKTRQRIEDYFDRPSSPTSPSSLIMISDVSCPRCSESLNHHSQRQCRLTGGKVLLQTPQSTLQICDEASEHFTTESSCLMYDTIVNSNCSALHLCTFDSEKGPLVSSLYNSDDMSDEHLPCSDNLPVQEEFDDDNELNKFYYISIGFTFIKSDDIYEDANEDERNFHSDCGYVYASQGHFRGPRRLNKTVRVNFPRPSGDSPRHKYHKTKYSKRIFRNSKSDIKNGCSDKLGLTDTMHSGQFMATFLVRSGVEQNPGPGGPGGPVSQNENMMYIYDAATNYPSPGAALGPIVADSTPAIGMNRNRDIVDAGQSLNGFSQEWVRFQSFNKWTKSGFPTPSMLAGAGFYYSDLGRGDEVECFSCHLKVTSWTPNMHPATVHNERAPDCLLVKGIEQGNTPFTCSSEEYRNIMSFLPSIDTSLLPSTLFQNASIANPQGMSLPLYTPPPRPQSPAVSATGRPTNTATTPFGAGTPDMRSESVRLATFSTWPKVNIVSPPSLAKSGLYFTGPVDRVECAFCHGKLEGWMMGDDAHAEHRKHFGRRCHFVQGVEVGNILIDATAADSTQVAPAPPVNNPRPPVTATDFGGRVRPRYVNYASLPSRENTFTDAWPVTHKSPNTMARSGFFYTGANDKVTCFQCAGSLNGWQSGDDPWVEHAHWFPHCDYVKQNKGQQFIDHVIENYAQLTAEAAALSGDQVEVTAPVQGADVPSQTPTVADIMSSQVVIQVLGFGVARDVVQRAAEDIVAQRGDMPDITKMLDMCSLVNGSSSSTTGANALPNRPTPVNNNPAVRPPLAGTSTQSTSLPPVAPSPPPRPPGPQHHSDGEEDMEHSPSDEKELANKYKALQESRTCKICLDEEINVVFLPCGHLVSCSICAPALSKCPICRSNITEAVRTFMS